MSIGIDIAQMDIPVVPNFVAAKAAGVSFVLMRKSQCYQDRRGSFVMVADPTYAHYADAARAAGLVVGGYLFPNFKRGAPSMADQVANFVAAGPARITGKDLPDFIDIEFPGNGIADTGRSQSDVATDVLTLSSLLRDRTGAHCGVYTSHVQTYDSNGLGGKLDAAIGEDTLWQKIPYHLAAQKPLDPTAPLLPHIGPANWDPHDYYRVPGPWEKRGYWIEQTQGDARGIAGVFQCDVNRWNYLTRSSGADVRIPWVQAQLAALGLQVTLNGIWDDMTNDAVKRLQERSGLEDDAVIGAATFAALYG